MSQRPTKRYSRLYLNVRSDGRKRTLLKHFARRPRLPHSGLFATHLPSSLTSAQARRSAHLHELDPTHGQRSRLPPQYFLGIFYRPPSSTEFSAAIGYFREILDRQSRPPPGTTASFTPTDISSSKTLLLLDPFSRRHDPRRPTRPSPPLWHVTDAPARLHRCRASSA